jgi:hypothetical protein
LADEPKSEEAVLLMGDYHAIAHTVGVDVLAFGGTGSARDRI